MPGDTPCRRKLSAASPNRGTGPLPDGYCGSGKAWQAVAGGTGQHWRGASSPGWTGTGDRLIAAERRAIQLARSLFGRGLPECPRGAGTASRLNRRGRRAARNHARPEYLESSGQQGLRCQQTRLGARGSHRATAPRQGTRSSGGRCQRATRAGRRPLTRPRLARSTGHPGRSVLPRR